MMGGGFLRQMNETLKYNRDLLGRKKTSKEKYAEDVKDRKVVYTDETRKYVHERLNLSIIRIYKQHQYYKIFNWILGFAFFVLLIMFLFPFIQNSVKPKNIKPSNEVSTRPNYVTSLTQLTPETTLRTEYFEHGLWAQETILVRGYKHNESTSYYESGEIFRKATYYHDTLLTESYYFKSGELIYNFPKLRENKVFNIKLLDSNRQKFITFNFYNNKLVPETYNEYPIRKD